jgi:hypothetical protein
MAALPVPLPDRGFDADFSRALAGDPKHTHLRDTLRKLAESEPEAFVRGIRSLMSD